MNLFWTQICRYTSGPSSDECESDSENEIEDNLKERVSLKESDALEKEEKKKGGGEEEEVSLLESERTAKDTKVDFSAKNATASETKSEIEKGTKTDETKITKSRVPILSGKKKRMTI